MKANELMIGDWVLTLESTHKKQVYAQIWAIEEGQTSILVKKDITNWFVDIEWIEPIPLTPEILEKNGFGNKFSDEYYGGEITIDLDLDEWVEEDEDGYVIAGHGKKINYVHKLQHALRLCGIEKEIEL